MSLWLYLLPALATVLLLLHLVFKAKRTKISFAGKKVLVSGASSGIGLEICKQVAREGASVIVLLARDQKRLQEAKQAVEKECVVSQKVYTLSCDVTNLAQIEKSFKELEEKEHVSYFDIAVLNQGYAAPGYFLEISNQEFEKQMQVNYLGYVYLAKRVLPGMLKQHSKDKQVRNLIFVGSAASFCSFVGYTAYAPTKYAVRALAEGLENELAGHGVNVHLGTPVDTKTPGFDKENETKPKETELISEGGTVYEAKDVAKMTLEDLKKGRFFLGQDWLTYLLGSMSRGTSDNGCPIFGTLASVVASCVAPFIRNDFFQKSLKFKEERNLRWEKLL